jgi:hypothetical protein
MGRTPVLMLGLDAADADVVDRLMAQGRLPNLRKLRHGGLFGRLSSPAGLYAGAVWPRRVIPYYRRAQERCGLGIFEYDAAYWQVQLRQPPLLSGDKDVEHAMFQVLPQRFGARYRARLHAAENIHLLLNAPVAGLRVGANGMVNGAAVCTLDGARIIARSSVFPSGGYADPTLTIVALAIRLADHLRACSSRSMPRNTGSLIRMS